MGRTKEPGIDFYSVKCNHISNRKIRLLINEFDSNGYWIWQCLLSEGYATKGYYYDCDDREALELFATDVCKKQVSLVEEVIAGCIRRGLFDESVFNMFGCLSSKHMQEMYVEATKERRRKGTEIIFIQEFLLVDLTEENRNISIIPWNKDILPRKNRIIPGKNPQSKVKESKVLVPNGTPGSDLPGNGNDLKELYKNQGKSKKELYHFIRDNRPTFIEPYRDFWNVFAQERSLAQVMTINDARKKKFKVRINEKEFDFIEILRRAALSDIIAQGKWFSFDWILESQGNYLKVLEGNYDNKTDLNKTANGQQNGISSEIYKARQKESAEQ